ncbi:hypothetical protein HAL07_06220 [Helicobacter ailurogastricus]|uniref:Uncharacterized protein n=1 Tax=Helicobacter ailurogastricus TaxID=1578720 RepID=A0A0K2Y399_9HELI|nr:hypothetical protein HAL07_06220 [Helicobacter ailurogastricus]
MPYNRFDPQKNTDKHPPLIFSFNEASTRLKTPLFLSSND